MGLSKNVIAYARSQIGYHEGYSNGHWNNHEKFASMVPGMQWVSDQGEPWCAVFDFACLAKGGCGTGGLIPTAGVDNLRRQGVTAGRFTEYPTVGGLLIIGGGVHTEIVTGFDSRYVYSVGGNTNSSGGSEGDGVHAHSRDRFVASITGYVLPFYDEHAVSADPKWNGKWLGAHPEAETKAVATAVKVNTTMTTTPTSSTAKPFSLGVLLAGMRDRGVPHGNVELLQRALEVAVGPTASPRDGVWRGIDGKRLDAYRRKLSDQQHLGWTDDDCTGAPGAASLHLLFSTPAVVKALGADYSAIVK